MWAVFRYNLIKTFIFLFEMKMLKSQGSANMMKIAKFWVLTGLIIAGAFIITCSDKKAIDLGEFEAGVYTNSFFNMMLSLPDTWHVLDQESLLELMKRGGKIAADGDKNLEATFNAAEQKTLNLLAAFEYPPSTAISTNPGIMVIAEKIKHTAGIKRGSDFHFQSKKTMKLSRLKVSYPEEIYEAIIDGVSFDVMETEITMGPGAVIQQRQYVTIMNGYALLVA